MLLRSFRLATNGNRSRRCSGRERRLSIERLEVRYLLAAFDVLAFTKTSGFRHDSIETGVAAIETLGAANDFSVTHTEDASAFTAANLAQYEAVVFLNTTGDVLDLAQQSAFEAYIQDGGGFVGVHSAADTEYGWQWYGDLLGGYFNSHPAIQQATVVVADRVNPSTAHLPERWARTDEWYNYNANPRGDVHVLATLDESTYSGGNQGFDHPISWYHYFDGGRSWYTGMGHTSATYSEPLFLDHLLGGIRFAAGQAPVDQGATVDANWRKVVLEEDVTAGLSLAVAPTGDVYFVQRGGQLKVYQPDIDNTTVVGQLSVYSQGEDGLLGLALDPDFTENQWIYLYYSPAGSEEIQRLSRFTLDGNSLDHDSEQVLLEIPVIRGGGHAAGSLAFDPDGNLYLSTGDDTDPFQSDGFAPIDERPGREFFDAQRSSGNTDDLRGKILRIRPEDDGTYSIPAGNLFPSDGSAGRPEIYVMGNRNPFRFSIDAETGWLYWGDVGPDAGGDDPDRGPRGYDEFNQAREAGNYGWPYIIADNQPYRDYNFATGVSGPAFNPAAPVNNSPNNTGATNLPPAQPALIWYPYAPSSEFPEFTVPGAGGRTAMAGPVYHFDRTLDSDIKLPEYLDGTLIVFDWSRDAFWEVKLDDNGQVLKINRMFPNLPFDKPIEAELGPDGALYVLEWGDDNGPFSSNNPDAQLVRIDYIGNLPRLVGDYNENGTVDAADYTVVRDSLGTTGESPADGDRNGVVNRADHGYWVLNFGQTLPEPAAGASAIAAADVAVASQFDEAAPSPVDTPIEPVTSAMSGPTALDRALTSLPLAGVHDSRFENRAVSEPLDGATADVNSSTTSRNDLLLLLAAHATRRPPLNGSAERPQTNDDADPRRELFAALDADFERIIEPLGAIFRQV